VKIEVLVKPRASRSRVLGVREGLLEVAVAAPPVDGAANDALLVCLADFLEVGRSALTIARGTRDVEPAKARRDRWGGARRRGAPNRCGDDALMSARRRRSRVLKMASSLFSMR
jgi:hypothetical protein